MSMQLLYPSFAHAQNCETIKNNLEKELLTDPDNHQLLLAYKLALSTCQDPISPQAKQNTNPTFSAKINLYGGYNTNPENNSDFEYYTLTDKQQSYQIQNQTRPTPSYYLGISAGFKLQAQQHQIAIATDTQKFREQNLADQSIYTIDYYNIKPDKLYELNLAKVQYQNTHYQEYGMGMTQMFQNQWLLRAGVLKRNFADYKILNAIEYRLDLIPIKIQVFSVQDHIQAKFSYTYNQPENDSRAGGVNQKVQMLLAYKVAKNKHTWQLNIQNNYQFDQQGYSDYLAHGDKRTMALNAIYASWTYRLNKNLNLLAQLSHAQQNSNISLFEWQNQQWRSGLEYVW